MKVRLVALIAAFALFSLMAISVPTAHAGTGAQCSSDPSEIHIKESVVISCSGFSPNTAVTAYYVEPDGAATALGAFSTLKTDETGQIAFGLNSYINSDSGHVGMALGNWTVVVDQKGLANAILAEGQATFRVIGGSEGVSGATLVSSAAKITKAESVTIYGSGFAPNERVSFWWEYPNGDCSSFTYHDFFYNTPAFRGFSSFELGTVSADAFGEVVFNVGWNYTACEGTYRIVARGNSSGLGAETWVTVTGLAVNANASLTASPNKVAALFDWVYFTGSGFGANEPISCWLRTPQNQVTVVDQLWQAPVKSDAGGNFSFSIYTGSFFPPFPYASEGALGVYAMTCRGNLSGANGIAEFTVTGGTFDP